MNKSLRIGLQTGITFGIAMAAFAYLRTNRLTPALINAASGVVFGTIMGWFSLRAERRLMEKGIDAGDLQPEQSRTVHYPESLQQSVEITKVALTKLRKFKGVSEIQVPPSLKAKTGVTMDCFGETVVARFSRAESGTTIQISSKPRIYGTQMDMGKGVENVETVVRYLLERGATRRVA